MSWGYQVGTLPRACGAGAHGRTARAGGGDGKRGAGQISARAAIVARSVACSLPAHDVLMVVLDVAVQVVPVDQNADRVVEEGVAHQRAKPPA